MAKRTHNCAQLSAKNVGEEVVLIGWAQRIRDHGGKKFIDLRDREGITQLVFDPDVTKEFEEIENVRREFLLEAIGKVRPRPDGTVNERLSTGEVEIIVDSFRVDNRCEVLPFEIDDEHFRDVNEELRLEYRYLDLRRPEMQQTLIRRHKFIKKVRDIFDDMGFVEIDTPLLTKSTPEGARDFLVPYRKKKGEFFALPQSPQLFKQLLMVAGFERYYQIATCMRDEDLRKDRQYEHKQLDLEMSFTDREELFQTLENLFVKSLKETYRIDIPKDFVILPYKEAMERFGSDKPDLRIKGLELVDISDVAKDCGFSVFKSVVERDGLVKGMRVPKGQDKYSRKDIDKLIEFAQQAGAKGMAWMKVIKDGEIESSISKFFKPEELKEINSRLAGEEGDLLFFIADSKKVTNDVLDVLRRHIAPQIGALDENAHVMSWIVEFPLFQWNDEEEKLDFEHNPFSMPLEEDIDYIMSLKREDVKKNKEKLLSLVSDCYDLVYNGVEIGSGARRIHKPELQNKMFELVDFSEQRIEEAFGWFIKAYNYGAPSHRGMGLGIDRIIMLAEKRESIREVIAFPRNKHGFDPLTRSPSSVDEKQLKELGIQVKKEKKD